MRFDLGAIAPASHSDLPTLGGVSMFDRIGDSRTVSVSELTMAIKERLEDSFPVVNVEGEVSNFKLSGAGHIYFTLKDSGAAISVALFRGRIRGMKTKPADGMMVIVSGKIDVYPPRGSYQLIAVDILTAGRGKLLEALEQRKKALASEGLFDQARKKSLPFYPRSVSVISSPTGAALQDILQVLARRSAAPRVTILPSLVQGPEAAEIIAAQIRRASAYNLGDVIILARGGGSLEDLMAFNEEVVVRAIGDCPIPLISGVGHEIDVSLADLAADVRAATPSAAAELVSDRSEDLLLRVRGLRKDITWAVQTRLSAIGERFGKLGVGELAGIVAVRLEEALRRSDEAREAIEAAGGNRLIELKHRLELAARALVDGSPRAIMKRGFARVTKNDIGIENPTQLARGDKIVLEFARGGADAEILGTRL